MFSAHFSAGPYRLLRRPVFARSILTFAAVGWILGYGQARRKWRCFDSHGLPIASSSRRPSSSTTWAMRIARTQASACNSFKPCGEWSGHRELCRHSFDPCRCLTDSGGLVGFLGRSCDRTNRWGNGQPQADGDDHGGDIAKWPDTNVLSQRSAEEHQDPCAQKKQWSRRHQSEEVSQRVSLLVFTIRTTLDSITPVMCTLFSS